MTLDPYETLGVGHDADENTVKQAYKKMAMKWHPDKNPTNQEEAEKRFKDINEAYNQITSQSGSIGIEELFGNLFGNMFGSQFRNHTIHEFHEIDVTLEELCVGTTKNFTYTINVINPDIPVSTCKSCNGKGQTMNKFDNSMMTICDCSACEGSGYRGKLMRKEVTKSVYILKSTDKIVFKKEGNQMLNGQFGDLIVNVSVLSHDVYELDGNDLHCEMNILFKESILGFERTLSHLDGSKFKIMVKGPISNEKVKKFRGKGLTDDGNLYIKFTFKINLTPDQIKLIEDNF